MKGIVMKEKNKKIIQDFINYLNSNEIKYRFEGWGYSYNNKIYDFIDFCYKNDITLEYNSEEERKRLQLMNVEEMSKDEIRKYLYVIFRGERFCSGLIMKNILNGKLKLLLEILIDSNVIV